MEYPFPPNSYAVLAKLWREDFEHADTQQAQEDALGEMEKLVLVQRLRTANVVDDYADKLRTTDAPFDVELMVDAWGTIRHLCNLIQVGASYLGLNGELYGLHEKIKVLAEED